MRYTFTDIAVLATAVFTAFSALGALLAARATKRAAEAQVLLNLLNDYAAPDMANALRVLIAWQHQHEDRFINEWWSGLKARDPRAQEVDRARRRVTSYFQNVEELHQAGLISRRTLRHAGGKSGLAVLVVVAQELERRLNPKVDLGFVRRLQKLCPEQVWIHTRIPPE